MKTETPECGICRAPKHQSETYCRDCQQAPILRRLFEERYGRDKKKRWWQ